MTGNLNHTITGKSSIFRHSRCYGIQSQENQAYSGTAGVMAALNNIYKKLLLSLLNCLQSDGTTGSEWDVFKQLRYMYILKNYNLLYAMSHKP